MKPMDIILNGQKKKCAFKGGEVVSFLSSLSLRSEEVLVKVNGSLVPEDAQISTKDEVEIIKVVFGG